MKYFSAMVIAALLLSCGVEREQEITGYVVESIHTTYLNYNVEPYVVSRFGGRMYDLENGVIGNARFIIVEHNDDFFAFYVPDEVWVGNDVTFTVVKKNNTYYLKNYKYEPRTRI